METGILYVVYNESIRNPETNERLYKIGITKNSVHDRYYGLGLKMPGKFETLFAYRLEDYAKAETIIHGILKKYRENGEWFNISQKELDHIKSTCELMGGECITELVMQEINSHSSKNTSIKTNSAIIPSHKLVNQNLNNFSNSVNPNFPCKVFLFNIGNTITENNNAYEATRKWWKITNEYRDTSKYEFAVGLVKGISVGSYKLIRWQYNQDYKKSKFDADEYPDFIGYSWHKQIEPAKGYFQYGNHLIVDFDGNGKFKILRGSPENKDIWFNC